MSESCHPAIYNYATPFYNGVSRAIYKMQNVRAGMKGGYTKLWTSSLERRNQSFNNDKTRFWLDSPITFQIIILIAFIKTTADLDTSIWLTIMENGNTYSFIDYRAQSNIWFDTIFGSSP